VFLYALVLLLCTYVLAFLSYHLLEKHFLRLKRPFELHERRREV
jgi:peptidoglycan/LPS O-acetylase OafA/YrhL